MPSARKPPATARLGVRALSAQATRDKILKAATQVFAKHGYQGGSVEKISRAAKSVDRMIYYYFGSKEGLFIEVIEDIYRRMNEAEAQLKLNTQDPVESLCQVIDFVLGYYRAHPEFITLLNTENLLQGRHIVQSTRAAQYSSPAVGVIADILRRGQDSGVFRADLQARQVYLLIVSTGYFLMSNRYTLSAFLGERVDSPENAQAWKDFVTDAVLRIVLTNPPPTGDSHGHRHP
ncbi:MAG: TetR/AcrR family transcriptional regulator [Alphaproteobacteria bacterium]|nr:TetR/AcrR family transcriptional regulator [Alphaproteobacteria bacterium]